MIRRFAVLLLAAGMLALTAAGTSAAVKRKPLGYRYGKCPSPRAACTFEGLVGPSNNKLALSTTTPCEQGGQALARLGYLPVKHGKFSANKDVTYENLRTYRKETVHLQVTGRLKTGKSIVGSFKFIIAGTACEAESGVAKAFSLKYQGPYYGG